MARFMCWKYLPLGSKWIGPWKYKQFFPRFRKTISIIFKQKWMCMKQDCVIILPSIGVCSLACIAVCHYLIVWLYDCKYRSTWPPTLHTQRSTHTHTACPPPHTQSEIIIRHYYISKHVSSILCGFFSWNVFMYQVEPFKFKLLSRTLHNWTVLLVWKVLVLSPPQQI